MDYAEHHSYLFELLREGGAMIQSMAVLKQGGPVGPSSNSGGYLEFWNEKWGQNFSSFRGAEFVRL